MGWCPRALAGVDLLEPFGEVGSHLYCAPGAVRACVYVNGCIEYGLDSCYVGITINTIPMQIRILGFRSKKIYPKEPRF